jgi:hypothetical protein
VIAQRISRRVLVWGSLAILALIGVVCAVLPGSRGVTEAQFKLLRPGMTQADVENLLYGRPRDDLAYSAIVWAPNLDGRKRSALISPGAPGVGYFVSEHFRDRPPNEARPKTAPEFWFFPGTTPEQGRQAVWSTETGLIAVYFGRDGRLEQKYFSTVDVTRPPTMLDWLASRPRMVRKSFGL